MIRIDHVSKSYDGGATLSVRDLSLEIRSGEIFGLTMTELAETPVAVFGKPAGSLLVLTLVAVFVQSLEGGLFKASAASDGGEE